jgi:Tol biopolymer transport system component
MLKSAGLRISTTLAAGLVLAAALAVVLLSGQRPAEAAFPGANGKIVFASDRTSGDGVDNPERDYEIFTMNANGTGIAQLTHNDTDDEEPAYSADGRQIAFVKWREWDPEDFQWTSDIYTMSADGTNETSVTSTDLLHEFSPSWSPDGKQIAFQRKDFDTNSSNIYKTSADGGKEVRLTKENGATEYYDPAWSPNGKRIAFWRHVPTDKRPWYRLEIVVIEPRPVGRTNHPIELGVGTQPSWSPDGTRIAFVRRGDVYRMASNGSKEQRLTQDAYMPAWSPDGTKIVVVRNINPPGEYSGNEIFVMNKNGSGKDRLTNNASGDYFLDWQPIVP